ncbi:MAG: hypothetical protein J6K62_05875 [Clostridia bacterium]|nr:hypothetical protein [Clostridia bacterium]
MSVVRVADFDLSKYSSETVFVLDTNILYFVHSGYYLPTDPKCICYSNLVQQIISDDRKIMVSALTIQELLFGIEGKEYSRYIDANGISKKSYSKKDYRKNTAERQSLRTKMQTVFAEIANTYTLVDGQITSGQIKNFTDQFDAHHYDPIDYVLVDDMLSKGTVVFVSDDTDFQYDTRIDLVTA